MIKYAVKRNGEVKDGEWKCVAFDTEYERTEFLNKACAKLVGEEEISYNDEDVTTYEFRSNNAEEVLAEVENKLANIDKQWKNRYEISEICDELSIFDWWNDYISASKLKAMKRFLELAIELGYTGYVCFKVGASGCANGMWANKKETETGHSPDGAFLYRSFTPDYTCYSVADEDGVCYPKGEAWNSVKTKKQVRELVKQVNDNQPPKVQAIKITFINSDGKEETAITEKDITFSDGKMRAEGMYYMYNIDVDKIVKIEKTEL